MTFFNRNLTFGENLHNNIIALFIVGVFLLAFVWVCNRTAKTEEQKEDAKTIFNYGVPVGAIAVIASVILYPIIQMNMM